MIADFLKVKQPKPNDEKYFANVKTQGKYWDKQADRSHAEDLANAKLNKRTKKSLFGMAKFEKAYVEGQKGRFATIPEGTPGRISRVGNMASKNAASIKTDTYRLRNLGRTSPSSVNRLAKLSGLEKAVVAGTRPFARRALPDQDVKQVRARKPRYGMTKGVGAYMDDKEVRVPVPQDAKKIKVKVKIKKALAPCDNCGLAPVSGGVPLCANCAQSMEKARKGGKHAPFVRTTGDDRDERGEDNEDEKADQLPRSFRKKSKAVFTSFPLGPLSKTYVRVDAAFAQGFLKADRRGYPQSQCPECGQHGNALEVMQHMQLTGHADDDKGKNKHTMIGRGSGVPELDGHTGMGTLKSMRKGMEFTVLDESDPTYHGHTGGGGGYAGKKWVHQHGTVVSGEDFIARGPKEDHKHFKMGGFTEHHSPSGYQEEIIGRTDRGEEDPACSLPNCRHPLSQHVPTDAGPMGCKDCNNTRPRRNVRHDFRA